MEFQDLIEEQLNYYRAVAIQNADFSMSEGKKFGILIAATILSARKLAELEDPDKLTPKKVGTVETAIRHAAHAPAPFTN